jgi:hypothetical protein
MNAIDKEYSKLQADLTDNLVGGGRLAVVKAPPGSGKTHLLIEVLANLVCEGQRVAVAVQTNAQADDICMRLAAHHPDVVTSRFTSKGRPVPDDMPASVLWIDDRTGLHAGAGITVATTAKWSLTQVSLPYDLLAVDEAWQMGWADLMQCATISERFMLIGDPGQIPPVVTIDVRRWETSPRAPHEAAPEIVLRDPDLMDQAFIGSLPACRRLPHESVDYVRPFYDFDFAAYLKRGSRGLDLPGHVLGILRDGQPAVVMVPTPDDGPPLEVDHELAETAARVVRELLHEGAVIRSGNGSRLIKMSDIGLTSSHRVMNTAIAMALGGMPGVRVDTPERWQGLQRPVMIAVHPLSGVTTPSAFDLETGRLCVMASRHQASLIVVARDHVGETLRNFIPSAQQAPGKPDIVGRGHDAHMKFWNHLETEGRMVSLS